MALPLLHHQQQTVSHMASPPPTKHVHQAITLHQEQVADADNTWMLFGEICSAGINTHDSLLAPPLQTAVSVPSQSSPLPKATARRNC